MWSTESLAVFVAQCHHMEHEVRPHVLQTRVDRPPASSQPSDTCKVPYPRRQSSLLVRGRRAPVAGAVERRSEKATLAKARGAARGHAAPHRNLTGSPHAVAGSPESPIRLASTNADCCLSQRSEAMGRVSDDCSVAVTPACTAASFPCSP